VGGNLATHGQGDLAHPYGFNTDMVNGLEVILPTGEIAQFGSCAIGSGWYSMHPLPDVGLFLGWNGTTGIITKVSIKLYPSKKYKEVDMFCVEDAELVPEVLYDITHVGMCEDLAAMSAAIPPMLDRLHHVVINISGDSKEELEFKRHLIYEGKLQKYIKNGTGGIVTAAQDPERPKTSKTADWKKGGGFEYVGAIMGIEHFPEAYREGLAIAEKYQIGYSLGARIIGAGHCMMFFFAYAFNRADPDDIKRASDALEATNEAALKMGGIPWKAELPSQKQIIEKMDPSTFSLMNRIRDILDTNRIMNPGNWEK
jgi:glycolate oxidase